VMSPFSPPVVKMAAACANVIRLIGLLAFTQIPVDNLLFGLLSYPIFRYVGS